MKKITAIAVPVGGDHSQLNAETVLYLIQQDLERYPELRNAASKIEEIVIIKNQSISPSQFGKNLMDLYSINSEANGWKTGKNFHAFENYGNGGVVYIGYPY